MTRVPGDPTQPQQPSDIQTPTAEEWAQLQREQLAQQNPQTVYQQQMMQLYQQNPQAFMAAMQGMGLNQQVVQPAAPAAQPQANQSPLEQELAQRKVELTALEQKAQQPGYVWTNEDSMAYQNLSNRVAVLEYQIPFEKQMLERVGQQEQWQRQSMMAQVPGLANEALQRIKAFNPGLFQPDVANGLPALDEQTVLNSAAEAISALAQQGRLGELFDGTQFNNHFFQWTGQLQAMRFQMAQRMKAPPTGQPGLPVGGAPPQHNQQQQQEIPLGQYRDLDL